MCLNTWELKWKTIMPTAKINKWFTVKPSAPTMELPILGCIDGDTIKTKLAQLPAPLCKVSIRLGGIDSAEIHSTDAGVHLLAEQAADKLKSLIGDAKTMTIANFAHDKYGGRIVATVIVNGININQAMMQSGDVHEYTGGRKQAWTA